MPSRFSIPCFPPVCTCDDGCGTGGCGVVDAALRAPAREAALLRKLEKRQRAGMARFSFFIYRFNGP